jgi:GTP-binding protein EngB required for normal cell division
MSGHDPTGAPTPGMEAARSRLSRVAADFFVRAGRAPRVVIVGMPGAGKSRLFNRLVGADVSPVSGQGYTTQRAVSASVEGATFVDTPSLRTGDEGGKGLAPEVLEADVALHLVACTGRISDQDLDLLDQIAPKKLVLVALNKIDVLSPRELNDVVEAARIFLEDLSLEPLSISAKANVGIDHLLNKIAERLEKYTPPPEPTAEEKAAEEEAEKVRQSPWYKLGAPVFGFAMSAAAAVVIIHHAQAPLPFLDVAAVSLCQFLMLGTLGRIFAQTGGFFASVKVGATIGGTAAYFLLCGKFRLIFPTLGLILDCIAAFLTTSAVGYVVGWGLVAAEQYIPPWLRALIKKNLG